MNDDTTSKAGKQTYTDADWHVFLGSLSAEIRAKMDRVRTLVGDANWGEDGTYKEALVRSLLRDFLPRRYEVSTGFVRWWEGQVSRQLDVVIWDSQNTAPIMREGEFVVLHPDSVEAVIEVKSSLTRTNLRDALELLHDPRWHCYANLPARSPVRAVLALTHRLPTSRKTPTEACFEELSGFYAAKYEDHCGTALCLRSKKVQRVSSEERNFHELGHILRPRFVNALDALCIADCCIIEQVPLTNRNGESPAKDLGFMAQDSRGQADGYLALAKLFVIIGEIMNRKHGPKWAVWHNRQHLSLPFSRPGLCVLGDAMGEKLPDGLSVWRPEKPLWTRPFESRIQPQDDWPLSWE